MKIGDVEYGSNFRNSDAKRSITFSNHDGIHNLGQFPAGVRQSVEIMLPGSSRLDQSTVTQEGQVMANGGLTLGSEIGAEFRDIPLLLAQQHQNLEPSRIGDLLEEFRHATDFRERPASGSSR